MQIEEIVDACDNISDARSLIVILKVVFKGEDTPLEDSRRGIFMALQRMDDVLEESENALLAVIAAEKEEDRGE